MIYYIGGSPRSQSHLKPTKVMILKFQNSQIESEIGRIWLIYVILAIYIYKTSQLQAGSRRGYLR